jgi:hypothetical protein
MFHHRQLHYKRLAIPVVPAPMKTSITFLLLASVALLSGCCTSRSHAKWEYQKVGTFDAVQRLAAEGWTLDSWHAFDSGDTGTRYILKRKTK